MHYKRRPVNALQQNQKNDVVCSSIKIRRKRQKLAFLKPWVSPKPDQLNQLDRNACRRWARGNNGLFPAHQAFGVN